MSKILLRNLITKAVPPIYNLFNVSFQTHHFSTKSLEKLSNESLFMVQYLVNSCGFTQERALRVSKYVKFHVSQKPYPAITFLKEHGFDSTQISRIVNYAPQVLVSNLEKTVLPKLEFLKSKGYSEADIAAIVAKFPSILLRSLENQLVPSFCFFMKFLQPDYLNTFKHCVGVLLFDLDNHRTGNIDVLTQAGVPVRNISFLLANHPRVLMTGTDKFKQSVDEVRSRGFDPLQLTFLIAVKVLRSMAKSTWDRKVEVYKKWGWSGKDFSAAFLYYPAIMALSEEKITSVMEFWVHEMGWESSYLASVPTIMAMSVEKRIKPRCKVYEALLLKGYTKPCRISLSTWLTINEKTFLQKIIDHHEEKATELLKLYNENCCK